MQAGFCTVEECPAAKTGHCFETKPTLGECEHWKAGQTATGQKKIEVSQSQSKKKHVIGTEEQLITWSGYPFQLADVELVSRRSNPLVIAPVGESFAGKSSFLGMLHTLMLGGHQLEDYKFAGSLTLQGWEELAASLRFSKGQASEPVPTPSDPFYYSLLHWALRQPNGILTDVLFADASGEVFSQWAIDRDDANAENVRWIHRTADAFLFFISCKSLIDGKSAAVTKLVDLANRLKDGLNGRPVIIVWAKADMIDDIRPAIKQRVDEQIEAIFQSAPSYETSKYLRDHPDQKQLNNLLLLDNLLNRIRDRRLAVPTLVKPSDTKDPFLMYTGDESRH